MFTESRDAFQFCSLLSYRVCRRSYLILSAPITTLAGSGGSGYADGSGTLAQFIGMWGVSISPDGVFALIVDATQNRGRVRRITIATGVVTTLAGSISDVHAAEPVDGAATAASFSSPCGVSISPNASFALVIDSFSSRVRRIEISTGFVTTLAGSTRGYADGVGTAAMFSSPRGVCISPDGSFAFVADTGNDRVRRLAIATGFVTTVAGSTTGYTDGAGTTAKFNHPTGIAISSDGSFALVADPSNSRVRRLAIATGVITTVVSPTLIISGGVVVGWSGDSPRDVAISPDASYALYVDSYSKYVQHVDLVSGVVTTLAGSNRPGYADGVGTSALFNQPSSVAIAPDGAYALIVEYPNLRVRRAALTSPCSAGYFCGAGSSSATQYSCVIDTYCPVASTNMTICPRGSYCALPAQSSYTLCPIGSFCSTTGLSAPTQCFAGSYCSMLGLFAPTGNCSAGYFCPTGSSSPTQVPCQPNYYCVSGSFNVLGAAQGQSAFYSTACVCLSSCHSNACERLGKNHTMHV